MVISTKNWLGPSSVLQKGTCADLPENGCSLFDYNERLWMTWQRLYNGQCSELHPDLTYSNAGVPAGLGLVISQRCPHTMADTSVEDRLEVLVEWNNTYTGIRPRNKDV